MNFRGGAQNPLPRLEPDAAFFPASPLLEGIIVLETTSILHRKGRPSGLFVFGLTALLFAAPTAFCAEAPAAANGNSPTAGKSGATTSGDTLAPDSNRIRLEFGSLSSFATGGKTSAYYLLEYEGHSLFSHNAPPTFVNPFGTVNRPDAPSSDPNKFAFRIERRQPGDNIADGDFLAHRILNLGGKSQVLGVIQFTPRSNFKQFNIAGGLESPTIAFLGFLNSGKHPLNVVNWLHFGMQGESQTRPVEEGGDQDVALVTYRAYFGKGFAPVERDVNRKARESLTLGAVRELTETPEGKFSPEKLKALLQKFADADAQATLLSPVEQVTVFALIGRTEGDNVKQNASDTEPGKLIPLKDPTNANLGHKFNEDFFNSENFKNELAKLAGPQTPSAGEAPVDIAHNEWERWTVAQFIPSAGRPVKDAAKIELYAESAGWYYLNGHFQTDRFQNLFSVNFKFHLHPEKASDNVWLRLRYENGTDRASPLVYRNFLSASIGISF